MANMIKLKTERDDNGIPIAPPLKFSLPDVPLKLEALLNDENKIERHNSVVVK